MTERCTLFLPYRAGLTRKRLQAVVGKDVSIEGARGAFVLSYPTFSIALSVVRQGELGDRLFATQWQLSRQVAPPLDERVQAVLERLGQTEAVVDVTVEPGHPPDGQSRRAVETLTAAYAALRLEGPMLYDERGQLLLSPVVRLPASTGPGPTARQLARCERSHAEMRRRGAPVYSGVLVVENDEEAEVRPAEEVALRLWCLWAVVLRAEGMPREAVHGLLTRAGAWSAVSSEEEEFLREEAPAPERGGPFVWRLEAVEALLWALGHLGELEWPAGFCNVPRQVSLLRPHEEQPRRLVEQATLRPVAELLDAQDLTLRQHWAIRTCYLNKERIPADLDWTGSAERLSVREAPVTGAVAERHRALNWLLNFGGADWDDVDTPT